MNQDRESRTQALLEALEERILVLDGAMGTALQAKNLTAADFGGPELEGCNENLVRTRPDVVQSVHEGYFEAGSDIVETDTFGGTPLVLGEYGLADDAFLLNEMAASIARRAADKFSTSKKPRWVAGSIGPTTKAISVTGGVTFEGLCATFHTQASGLLAGGADILLVETQQDTRNAKAALIAVEQAFRELGYRVPVMLSVTIEPTGTMLAGQGIEALAASVMHVPLLSLGLNCATGPAFMTDHVRSLAALTTRYVSCYPNAGLPDHDGKYSETPEGIAATLEKFVDRGWVNVLGGCCGTTAPHIRAIAQMAEGKKPRVPPAARRTLFSGIDFVEPDADNRPLIVGERTNVLGSRRFKKLIVEGKYEESAEIARAQVKGGAQIIDVCLQNPDRDEMADTEEFLKHAIKMVKVPLMIDSTDAAVIARALPYCQGKSIINSINMEDGEDRFEKVIPLARKYGAALIVGCIDEDRDNGMAVTRQRKLAVAQRSFQVLTEKFGVAAEDIIWDPLVFPCATGDAKYVGSAVETIEGIRLIKEALPGTHTILGISNVSFGLPDAGREVLNAVFLYHCTKAGLDMAIVNSEKLERYASIPEEERRLAEDLLWNRGGDPVAAFADHFRGRKASVTKKTRDDLPIDGRISACIVQGTKEGLIEDLAVKLQTEKPLDIINGPLMKGMDEVGRLFNANELIVAEVLQSAEAMKAAVSYLEGFMEKADTASRGKVILATVKGDVHDIGKNLVEIVFKNNGYKVVNLGIKVPPEVLIKESRDHAPDVIGLSGLLVKSAQQMVITAGDLREAGISVPILVGGAALTQRFTTERIGPAYGSPVIYAKDAMTGLSLLHGIMKGERPPDPASYPTVADAPAPVVPVAIGARASSDDVPIPKAPYLDRRVLLAPSLDDIWSYINPAMLYGRHMGLKGKFDELIGKGDERALRLRDTMDAIKAECRAFMKVRCVWQYVEAEPDGDAIHLFAPGRAMPVHTFRFPRRREAPTFCLSDFVLPPKDGRRDHVALFVTTAGEGVRARSTEAKDRGEYLRSHGMQALAIESAEAAAEWLHERLRREWGFPDPDGTTRAQLFQARYRGKRYSFGYPACPDLEAQEGLFSVLRPEEIGVHLTDGFMMDPEASVSALVFHHPGAVYFSTLATGV
ncbi:MAG: methionine synthase [Acidobacteriota bacterium]